MAPITPTLIEGTTTTTAMPSPPPEPESQTRIEIYTDGSCIGNPGPGGYGIVTLRRDAGGKIVKERQQSGHEASLTTNIRMEMTAACVALESLVPPGRVPTGEPITLLCDANLIPNAMNGWLAKWKAKGWRKSDGKAVDNQDLWERLERAIGELHVTFTWVRGHDGTEYNEQADGLAYAAARKAEKLMQQGKGA